MALYERIAFVALLGCPLVVACSSATGASNGGGTGAAAGSGGMSGGAGGGGTSGSGASGGSAGSGATGGTSGSGGTGFDGGGGSGGTQSGPPIIYANTDKTLYTLDPQSGALTQIGDFDCIGGNGQDTAMTDVAVDKNVTLWGISSNAVHPLTVQGSSVHCETPITLNNPKSVHFYGLTFAPAGVLDPSKEVLVAGNTDGELWSIDAQGNLKLLGNFGNVPPNDGNGHSYQNAGKPWELSGDIVFLANQGNPIGFATVRDCPNPPSATNCNTVNTLIEINVAALAGSGSITQSVRGQIVRGSGCNDSTNGDYGNMYGIAAWNAKVFGFSRTGDLVDVDTTDGSACLVKGYGNNKWAGAGVTTLAPVQAPPPK